MDELKLIGYYMSCCCSKNLDCKSVDVLSKILADSYTLFLKTQNVHWNVEAPEFRSIHLMTEEHYNDLFMAIDIIAERIRMVGGKAPATFEEFSKLASFSDKLDSSDAMAMMEELLKSHKTICDDLRSGIEIISESNDFGTVDVLNARLAFHEKTIWMLKATLNK